MVVLIVLEFFMIMAMVRLSLGLAHLGTPMPSAMLTLYRQCVLVRVPAQGV